MRTNKKDKENRI